MIEVIALLTSGFWMLMIFDCVRNDPERNTWLWVLLFLNFPGAVIYLLVRRLPSMNIPTPSMFKRWTMREQLWNAEAGVRNIGKAHQYVTLGNVLLDIGENRRASEAFHQALAKEPDNIHAHWGIAAIAFKTKQYAIASQHLQTVLKHTPDYKCGEASLLYGKALFELNDWYSAKPHLEYDIKYWSHPESSLLLAQILIAEGQRPIARYCLETMIAKVKASPAYHYRRHMSVVRQANKLLKNLA